MEEHLYVRGATFGHGAALAGGNAQGGAVTIGSDTNSAIGLLANAIVELAPSVQPFKGRRRTPPKGGASTPLHLHLTGRCKRRARPIRVEDKGCPGRFAAVGTMAGAYHKRFATHGEAHGTTEAVCRCARERPADRSQHDVTRWIIALLNHNGRSRSPASPAAWMRDPALASVASHPCPCTTTSTQYEEELL